MKRHEIAEKLREIISESTGAPLDRIENDTRLGQDLSLDSLDMVDLALEIEDEFKIDLEDLNEKHHAEITFGELVTMVANKLA